MPDVIFLLTIMREGYLSVLLLGVYDEVLFAEVIHEGVDGVDLPQVLVHGSAETSD